MIDPDEMQRILEANNIGFALKEVQHGRQFRFEDGAIATVYTSGKVVWGGKDKASETAARVKKLCGDEAAVPAPTSAPKPNVISTANNRVFIVYGHDIEAREQLELLLRRMKLEPVILQNLMNWEYRVLFHLKLLCFLSLHHHLKPHKYYH